MNTVQTRQFTVDEYHQLSDAGILFHTERVELLDGNIIQKTDQTKRRFTVDEYHRMSELCILPHTERTELLEGEIIQMVAQGKAHAVATRRTNDLFKLTLTNRAAVHVQAPITLPDLSEPEPDVTVTVIDPQDFITHHPGPEEVLLLIEVADSSLKYDLMRKGSIYARAGIQECWVLDVIDRKLFVFQQPTSSGYQSQVILSDTDSISPLAFQDFEIKLTDILPPVIN